jgi:hypothetical protein
LFSEALAKIGFDFVGTKSTMLCKLNIKFIIVRLVVIDTRFGREDESSIPATAIGRRLKPLDARTDPRIKLDGPMGRILIVKKTLSSLISGRKAC